MRVLLFILIAFTGVTATVCGLLMIANPDGAFGLTKDILETTFFHNFLLPGLLLTIVGTINLLAVFARLQKSRLEYQWAMAGGMMVTGWIVGQAILLPVYSWLQVVYLVAGVLTILISCQLRGNWAA